MRERQSATKGSAGRDRQHVKQTSDIAEEAGLFHACSRVPPSRLRWKFSALHYPLHCTAPQPPDDLSCSALVVVVVVVVVRLVMWATAFERDGF